MEMIIILSGTSIDENKLIQSFSFESDIFFHNTNDLNDIDKTFTRYEVVTISFY